MSPWVLCLIVLGLACPLIAAPPPATLPAATVTRDIVYGTAGGVKLKLDISVPDGHGPHPAVLMVHGGGWQAGDKTHFRSLFDPLTRAGYAWVSINYRLAPKFPIPDAASDVETAMAWLRDNAANYGIDPARVALLGESAGGHLVELAAAKLTKDSPLRPAGVVALYAPSDLTALAASTAARGIPVVPLLKTLFGMDELNDAARTALRDASPITYVKPGLPPFLLLHGTADQLVPVAQSVAFQTALKAAGVPCELITVHNGPHGMGLWNLIDPSYKDKILGFLDATLNPTPCPTSPVQGIR